MLYLIIGIILGYILGKFPQILDYIKSLFKKKENE